MYRSVNYTSDNGLSVTLGHSPPYFMHTKPRCTLSSESQIVKPPGRDGADEYNVTRGRWNVLLDGGIVAIGNRSVSAQRELDRLRAHLTSVFDPKRFGTLVFHTANGSFQLPRCRASATPQYGTCVENYLPFAIEIMSERSEWESTQENSIALGTSYFNLRFPWFLPESGTPMDVRFADAKISNNTTLDIFPVIEVFDTKGAMVTLVNETTGAQLSFSHAVDDNQKLIVDVANAEVTLYERDGEDWRYAEDVLHWMTPDSDLDSFIAVPGENIFNINNDAPGEKPTMTVRWRVPAVGV